MFNLHNYDWEKSSKSGEELSSDAVHFTPGRIILGFVVAGLFAHFVYPLPQMRERGRLEQEARERVVEEERRQAAIKKEAERREKNKMLAGASTDQIRTLVDDCKSKIKQKIGTAGVTFPRLDNRTFDTFRSVAALYGGSPDSAYLLESDSADLVLDNQERLRGDPYLPSIQVFAQYRADTIVGVRTWVEKYSCRLDGFNVGKPYKDDYVMFK